MLRRDLTGNADALVGSRRDVAELKAWSRRAWWAEHDTTRQRVRAVADLVLTPWRSTKEIAQVFSEYAPFVSRQFGVAPHRQLLRLFRARIRHGLDPIAYYRFQLFRPEQWNRAGQYIQTGDTGRVLRWLVASTPGYPRVFGDKRAFEAWCAEHNLPSTPTLMEFEGGEVKRDLTSGGFPPAIDLFSKPSNWHGGQGTERWIWDGRGYYVGSDGRARDPATLVGELARMSVEYDRPILLQPLLRNAPPDRGLTTGALCTARILTTRQPEGIPQLLHGVYRMPTGRTVADNFYLGGLAAQIDLTTGRLARAVRKDLRLLPAPTDRHPDTGAIIEGHQLTRWPEAVALVLRAHSAITWQGVPCIGWDVALLDDGPVLLEGNNLPCSTFAQMASGAPLGETAFVACINAHLRERFSSSSTPS